MRLFLNKGVEVLTRLIKEMGCLKPLALECHLGPNPLINEEDMGCQGLTLLHCDCAIPCHLQLRSTIPGRPDR